MSSTLSDAYQEKFNFKEDNTQKINLKDRLKNLMDKIDSENKLD